MSRFQSLLAPLLSVFCLSGIGYIAHAADRTTRALKDIDVEISGSVIDRETKKPISGAYVFVVYGAPSKEPNVLYDGCIKIKGTYVDESGMFRFAPEKLDDMVLGYVQAVAPDYYHGSSNTRGKGLVIEMIKRDLSDNFDSDSVKRDLHGSEHGLLSKSTLDCWKAGTRQDAAAAIPALEILKAQFVKYQLGNNGSIGLDLAQQASRIIHLLKLLPAKSSNSQLKLDNSIQR